MAVKFMSSLLFVVLSVLVPSSLIEADNNDGQYHPIEDLKDPKVVAVTKFAVTEHNNKAGTNLEFVSIVTGEVKAVAGYEYMFVIPVKNGRTGQQENYLTVVHTKPWIKYMELISFDRTNS